ncbi:hypothetical protein MPH_05797 [Macrophomina phaseolina MS6]|uniref:Rhodopsin domain-containing protein n=1 Tax=Macrophomina phaseolina (strain MS6) TaxID=1126212 RepID=K2RW85_MACPH|nr:hypothetical protein MPH_05797 [Macrophomina phaseolina MS6]
MRCCMGRVSIAPLLVWEWSAYFGVRKILAMMYSATAFVMHRFGGGYHAWEISSQEYKGFLKALYADTIVYGPNAYFTKVALLLVIVRVFSAFKTTKMVTYVFMGAMAGYYLPVMFIKTFICTPINGYWDSSIHAKCLDQRGVFVADTVISAVTDLAVLVIPIPATLALRMPLKKKVKVWVMLGVGGIATLASFIRLVLVIKMQESDDQTVDFVRFNLLGYYEIFSPVLIWGITHCFQ